MKWLVRKLLRNWEKISESVMGRCSGGAIELPEHAPVLLETELEQVPILFRLAAKKACSFALSTVF